MGRGFARTIWGLAVVASLILPAGLTVAAAPVRSIKIVLFGPVDLKVTGYLERKLGDSFHAQVSVERPPVDIPQDAFNARRGQYLSTALLQQISKISKSGDEIIFGVTNADLYVPGLNFVFGQADVSARNTVIALRRLHPAPGQSETLFLDRSLKEAVHEIGHAIGLGHCPDGRCVMFFSNSLMDTDRKESTFCSKCRQRLGE